MTPSAIYSFKVWIFTIIISPLIYLFLAEAFGPFNIMDVLNNFIPYFLWGGLISLPFLLLFMNASNYFFVKTADQNLVKAQLTLIGIIVTIMPIATIYLILGDFISAIILGFFYSIVITFAIWFFKIKRKIHFKKMHPDILDDIF